MTCPSCNGPIDQCRHERPFYPQMTVCYKTMERQAAVARWAKLHEKEPYHDGSFQVWSKTRTPETPYHYDDGVTIWVTDTDHGIGGDFLGEGYEPPAPE